MILKANRMNNGYDSEELYFEKLNRELISKLKTEEDAPPTDINPSHEGAQILQFTPRKAAEKKAA